MIKSTKKNLEEYKEKKEKPEIKGRIGRCLSTYYLCYTPATTTKPAATKERTRKYCLERAKWAHLIEQFDAENPMAPYGADMAKIAEAQRALIGEKADTGGAFSRPENEGHGKLSYNLLPIPPPTVTPKQVTLNPRRPHPPPTRPGVPQFNPLPAGTGMPPQFHQHPVPTTSKSLPPTIRF